MEFVKDITINDKYKTKAKIEYESYPYAGQIVKVSFSVNDGKGQCFSVPILLDECKKDGVLDPKLAITIASEMFLDFKEKEETEKKILEEFKLWNGVINIEEQ